MIQTLPLHLMTVHNLLPRYNKKVKGTSYSCKSRGLKRYFMFKVCTASRCTVVAAFPESDACKNNFTRFPCILSMCCVAFVRPRETEKGSSLQVSHAHCVLACSHRNQQQRYGCETKYTHRLCSSRSVVFISLCSFPAFLCRVFEFRYIQPAYHIKCAVTICNQLPV